MTWEGHIKCATIDNEGVIFEVIPIWPARILIEQLSKKYHNGLDLRCIGKVT